MFLPIIGKPIKPLFQKSNIALWEKKPEKQTML
ncbi:MAG: hypothetical protein, partial [Olavius algarvensis Gamma 1 endosymbiont]